MQNGAARSTTTPSGASGEGVGGGRKGHVGPAAGSPLRTGARARSGGASPSLTHCGWCIASSSEPSSAARPFNARAAMMSSGENPDARAVALVTPVLAESMVTCRERVIGSAPSLADIRGHGGARSPHVASPEGPLDGWRRPYRLCPRRPAEAGHRRAPPRGRVAEGGMSRSG
jgi:hypothetical protein